MVRDTEEDCSNDSTAEAARQPDRAWILHCAGDAYGLVLGDLLEAQYRISVQDHNGLYLTVEGVPPAGLLQFSAEQVRERVRRRWQQFESWYDLGRFQNQLPLEIRRRAVIEAFDVREFLSIFSGCKITEFRPRSGQQDSQDC